MNYAIYVNIDSIFLLIVQLPFNVYVKYNNVFYFYENYVRFHRSAK